MSGHLTDTIKLEQGVPQGDVISPYLFILMVEILLIKINYTKNLTGITYASHESRSETFADDTTIFLTRTENNLRFAKKYLVDFHVLSGLACNIDKTVVIPLGQITDPNITMCDDLGLVWDKEFTILGFFIDNKMEQLDKNFELVTDKIKGLIGTWRPYHLSLNGRCAIAKVKLVSQLTYISSVLDIPKDFINKTQTLIDEFIMGIKKGGRHWIGKDILYTHPKKGGGRNDQYK